MELVSLCFLFCAFAGSPDCVGQEQHASSEQMHFSAEDSGVKKPVPIPESVLAILRSDDTVRRALEDKMMSSKDLPSSWFLASEIHLSTRNRPDLVVIGQAPISGANVTTFWVFLAEIGGFKLVMTAPAHDLIVKKARWKGVRDLELASMTAVQISTVLLRFNGKRYVERSATSQAIE